MQEAAAAASRAKRNECHSPPLTKAISKGLTIPDLFLRLTSEDGGNHGLGSVQLQATLQLLDQSIHGLGHGGDREWLRLDDIVKGELNQSANL